MSEGIVYHFAKVESEIASYGIAPPTPWPWAVNSDGTTDVALRLHQLIEFRDQLKKATPQEIVEMGKKTAAQWHVRAHMRRRKEASRAKSI